MKGAWLRVRRMTGSVFTILTHVFMRVFFVAVSSSATESYCGVLR